MTCDGFLALLVKDCHLKILLWQFIGFKERYAEHDGGSYFSENSPRKS